MNERIYELYRQAHLVREYPADDPMRGGNPPTVYWGGDESAKKFAELIVGECVNICDDLQDIPATEPRHCAEDIRIHFGLDNK